MKSKKNKQKQQKESKKVSDSSMVGIRRENVEKGRKKEGESYEQNCAYMIESKRGQYKSDNNRSNDKKKSCDNNHMTLLTINF